MEKPRLAYLCSIATLILIAATGCGQQDVAVPAPIITKTSAAQTTTATPLPAATPHVWTAADEQQYRAAQQQNFPEMASSPYPKAQVVRMRRTKHRLRRKSQSTPEVELPMQDNSTMDENNAENASSAPASPDIIIHRYADLIRKTDDRDQLLKIRFQIADNANDVGNATINQAFNSGTSPDGNSPGFAISSRLNQLANAIDYKINSYDEVIPPYSKNDLQVSEQLLQWAEYPELNKQWSRDVVNQAQQMESQDNARR